MGDLPLGRGATTCVPKRVGPTVVTQVGVEKKDDFS